MRAYLLRLPEKSYLALRAKAKKLGQSLAALLRDLISRELKR